MGMRGLLLDCFMLGCMYMKMITRDFVMGWVVGLLYILQVFPFIYQYPYLLYDLVDSDISTGA